MGHDSAQVRHDADTTAEQEDLVGVAEASRLLNVSPDAVRARCRRGKLPSVKIDGRIMIPRASLHVPTVDTTGRHDTNTTESVADTTGRHDTNMTESVADTTGDTTTWPLADTTATRQGDRRPEQVVDLTQRLRKAESRIDDLIGTNVDLARQIDRLTSIVEREQALRAAERMPELESNTEPTAREVTIRDSTRKRWYQFWRSRQVRIGHA
jgi:hypothetical protein